MKNNLDLHVDLVAFFGFQTTQKYELLNYGEHGTVVDDVLYSCNYIKKPVVKKEKEKDNCSRFRDQDPTNAIRSIVSKSKSLKEEEAEKCEDRQVTCKCSTKSQPSEELDEGWENSAIVQHGSVLSFGCLVFVFNTLGIYQMP